MTFDRVNTGYATIMVVVVVLAMAFLIHGCEGTTTATCPNGTKVEIKVTEGMETNLFESGSEITELCKGTER